MLLYAIDLWIGLSGTIWGIHFTYSCTNCIALSQTWKLCLFLFMSQWGGDIHCSHFRVVMITCGCYTAPCLCHVWGLGATSIPTHPSSNTESFRNSPMQIHWQRPSISVSGECNLSDNKNSTVHGLDFPSHPFSITRQLVRGPHIAQASIGGCRASVCINLPARPSLCWPDHA